MFQNIDHIGVLVKDIDSSLSFYLEDLEMILVHDEYLIERGIRLAYLLFNPNKSDTMIQLIQPLYSGKLQQILEQHGEGLHHLCFSVTDISTLSKNISNNQTDIFIGGRGQRCTFLASPPNGLQIELTEKP